MSFNQGHALLIGIGSHQHHQDLDVPITVADAQAVQSVLQNSSYCGYLADNVKLLKNETAVKENVLQALDDLTQVQPTDTVFLFYAGHGSIGTDGNYYLLTHDVKVSEHNGRKVKAGTGISEAELLQKLKAIPAKRLFMVFNACHSGHIAPQTLAADQAALPETLNPTGRTADALLGTGEGRILIVASREEQYSFIGEGDTTIFTQALTNGLKGEAGNNNGMISAFGLYEYLYHEVSEAVDDMGYEQEPMLTVVRGVGPFPVALYRGASDLGEFADDRNLLEGTAVKEVSQRKVDRSFNRIVNTGGGAYIEGNVSTGGGDFVGRDQIIHGDQVRGDKIMGDKVGGDKIAGDKISVGDIKDSSSVAIGRGATAVGERGVSVGGSVGGSIITGDGSEASGIQAHTIKADHVVSGVQQLGGSAADSADLVALAKALGTGSIKADSIEAKNVVSGLQYISDPNQATPDQLRRELAALKMQLEQAIAAGEIEDAGNAEDLQAGLTTAEAELAKPNPSGNRVVRKLKTVTEILTESATAAQAAKKTGVAILKLAPVAATLYQIATNLFAR